MKQQRDQLPKGQSFKDYKNRQQKRKPNRPHEDYIVGIHPVSEALKGNRTINKVMIAKGKRSQAVHQIIELAKARRLVIQEVDTQAIVKVAGGSAHQGVAAYLSPYNYLALKDVLAAPADCTVLALNNLTDVHNFGSILRTCDAVSIDYIIIPERRSVQVNATVGKTSAGAVEHVKIVRVKSLGNAINDLKKAGYWVTGADMDGAVDYTQGDYSGKRVIVLGSEGEGLSPHIKRLCDQLVYIPMIGQVNSLNVSVATSLLLYEWRRKRDVQS